MNKDKDTDFYVEGGLVDENFSGAFVGGPPILSAEQLEWLKEHPEKAKAVAMKAIEEFLEETDPDAEDLDTAQTDRTR